MNRLLFSICIVLTWWGGVATAEAAVTISEVAWMGSVASANHEWIELYNSGDAAVDLTDWTLVDGVNLAIPLSGTIASQEYVVLERTSDASAPGTAFLIYTGALVNTGATLILRRNDGQIEDQVVGGENWQNIGGDNTTKDTAQYTSGGWKTAAPTPKAAPGLAVATETVPPATSSETTAVAVVAAAASNGSRAAQSRTVPMVKSTAPLVLRIDAQNIAYVSQPVTFRAAPSGIGDTIINSLQYTWNFGDFETASGSQPVHHFRYPGTYIVTVRATFGRHNTLARHEITVLPVRVEVSAHSPGVVVIRNMAEYDVDISGFRLVGNDKELVVPADSLIMAKQAVSVVVPTTYGSSYVLKDARGTVVAQSDTAIPAKEEREGAVQDEGVAQVVPTGTQARIGRPLLQSATTIANEPLTAAFGFATLANAASAASAFAGDVATSIVPRDETTSTSTIVAAESSGRVWWPYLALFCVLMGTLVGLYVVRERSS